MAILKTLVGVVFWIGVATLLVGVATTQRGSTTVSSELERYFTQKGIELEIDFGRPNLVELGDGVYLDSGRGWVPPDARRIGEVRGLLGEAGQLLKDEEKRVRAVRVLIFDRSRPSLRADATARLLVIPESPMKWIWQTLFTDENLPLVVEELTRRLDPHWAEALELLKPAGEALLGDIELTIETDGAPFLRRHRPRLQHLVRKIEADLGEETLAGLFEEEVWPIAKRRLQPVFDTVGRKIWESFPLWGLTWRLAYQSLPLTHDDHFEKRWKRFIAEEVVPIVKSHAGDLISATKLIAQDTVSNPRVYTTLHDALVRLLEDPELHALAWDFVEEVFIKNDRFHARMKERWKSPETKRAFASVARLIQLEPMLQRIGEIVLGTRTSGITPEFARVLRAQILEKDARRLVIAPGRADRPLPDGSRLEGRIEPETRP